MQMYSAVRRFILAARPTFDTKSDTKSEAMGEIGTTQHSLISLPYAALRKVDVERRRQERRAVEQRRAERRLQENRRKGKRQSTVDELRRYLQSRGIDDSQIAPYCAALTTREGPRERRNNGRRSRDRRSAERRHRERRSASKIKHPKMDRMVQARISRDRAPRS